MRRAYIMLLACMLIMQMPKIFAQSNSSALIPIPNSIEYCTDGNTFKFNVKSVIKSNLHENTFIIKELKKVLATRLGLEFSINNSRNKNIIEIGIDTTLHGDEHYTLKVDKRGVTIKGATEGALYWGLQTLDQILLGDVCNTTAQRIEYIAIDDAPRYPHRAIMLDPARHFLPVKDIKFFIDQMARFKFNVLQLHLTDDQGWRIEIKSHPELTERGAFRKPGASNQGPDNGYYTQDDIREIIAYAAERNIEVIPELDIPGHSVAILSAHPQLGCSFRHNEKKELGTTTNMMLCAANEEVYSIYKDIIAEVAGLFPSDRIHLGGDEAAVKENWAKCPHCIAMMQKLGYENPSQLMIPFFNMVLDFVRCNGKKAILWCELDNMWPPANDYLFPYPKDVTLVTWRNALTPKCVELTCINGHELIMAPGEHAYLDYPQYPGDLPEFNNWGMPITTLEQSYRLDPGLGLQPEEQAHITGVMATLWGEAIRDINRVTYMAFPRAMAIAEAGWSQMEQRAWKSFRQRIYPNITEMMKNGVSVRVPFEIVERK
ncbi:MAG: beta-N-acetylhexosaminidase [Bacteroidaceae bacterium]|nr:beta-N-acetylhexosaminidase [Bacteroidaceae bacterium]